MDATRATEQGRSAGLRPARTNLGFYKHHGLPHFDVPGRPQFVTFRTADSVPAAVLRGWDEELAHLDAGARQDELSRRIERFLDVGSGSCPLADRRIAQLVADAFEYFAGERYDLHAWVVMPNHTHQLFTLYPGEQLGGW